jgi:hypothetical protein
MLVSSGYYTEADDGSRRASPSWFATKRGARNPKQKVLTQKPHKAYFEVMDETV